MSVIDLVLRNASEPAAGEYSMFFIIIMAAISTGATSLTHEIAGVLAHTGAIIAYLTF